MEIAHCRYFLALCQEGNFTRAAKRCGVAQPSLTRAIRKLERELGEPLFVRRHERTNLTPFGWEVFPYFDAIARCVTEIKRGPQGISTADCKAANEIVRMLDLASWTTVPSMSVFARASNPADQQVSLVE
jgi:molybdenum-dependent DNA-binding transcriptional regulator ModE